MTANDLALMRGVQALFMPDTCDILSLAAPASDSMGGQVSNDGAYTVLHSGVPCRLAHGTEGGAERRVTERMNASTGQMISLPWDTTGVTTGCRIKVTSQSNRVFDITAVAAKSWITALRVTCVEVSAP